MNNWKHELCSQIIERAKDLYKANGEHDIRFVPERILKEEETLTVGDLKKKLSCLRDDLPVRSLNDDRYLTGFYNAIDIGNEKDAIYLVPDEKCVAKDYCDVYESYLESRKDGLNETTN